MEEGTLLFSLFVLNLNGKFAHSVAAESKFFRTAARTEAQQLSRNPSVVTTETNNYKILSLSVLR